MYISLYIFRLKERNTKISQYTISNQDIVPISIYIFRSGSFTNAAIYPPRKWGRKVRRVWIVGCVRICCMNPPWHARRFFQSFASDLSMFLITCFTANHLYPMQKLPQNREFCCSVLLWETKPWPLESRWYFLLIFAFAFVLSFASKLYIETLKASIASWVLLPKHYTHTQHMSA